MRKKEKWLSSALMTTGPCLRSDNFNSSMLNLHSSLFLFAPPIAMQENQTALEVCQAECREVLHRLLPNVPLPSEQVWVFYFFYNAYCDLKTLLTPLCFSFLCRFTEVSLFFLLSPLSTRTITSGSTDFRGQQLKAQLNNPPLHQGTLR